MYVKVFNSILDSSIADNRRLRHFFTDLLLCSDPDGNVLMTKSAIARRIKADMEEVEWGLEELQKPDPMSNHPDCEGRRIIPLEGHAYGWKIVTYEAYRDLKSAAQMRAETAERVKKFRENKKAKFKRGTPLPGERNFCEAEKRGASEEELNRLSEPQPKKEPIYGSE